MILLDTHVWIWWVSDPDRLSKRAADAILQADTLGVPSICCWEVATRVQLGKLHLDREITLWVRQALSQDRIVSLDMTSEVALEAALLAGQGMHGDPADRIIAATAISAGSPLVTKDRALRKFVPLTTIW